MATHVRIEGIHGLTLAQAEALLAAAGSTLERDSWADESSRSLSNKQTKSAHEALSKLATAIAWHKQTSR